MSTQVSRRRGVTVLTAMLALSAILAALPADGRRVPDPLGLASADAAKQRGVSVHTSTIVLTRPDEKRRATVSCPGGRNVVPLGGGMTSTPAPGLGGEGVYPHSYERLGAQRGWHVTPVLFDPTPIGTTPRTVTLQVVCGPKTRHIVPVRRTVYVQPGETQAAEASCPAGRRLFAGGFQRTNFVSRGGNYVTSSHAASATSWRVTGSAFGGFGGELTSIAYCRRSGRPLVTEVSATASIRPLSHGTAATPSCPPGRKMIAGGFSTFPSGSTLVSDGIIGTDGSWSAGGYNAFGPTALVTAYGYCHSAKFPRPDKGENPHRSLVAPPQLQRAEKAAISERVANGGCYPSPSPLAKGIARRTKLRTAVAQTPRGVNRPGTVYVIRQGASCELSRLAFRSGARGKVFMINSATGAVTAN